MSTAYQDLTEISIELQKTFSRREALLDYINDNPEFYSNSIFNDIEKLNDEIIKLAELSILFAKMIKDNNTVTFKTRPNLQKIMEGKNEKDNTSNDDSI